MANHNRSTKGASKQRRDHINVEIQRLRELMPLSDSIKERLFQLQIMSLSCIYIRKHRYLPHLLHDRQIGQSFSQPLPRFVNPSQTLRGFLIMLTRHGKLLHISDNVSDYLGHSVEEIMSQGDNIYDLVDARDHRQLQSELLAGPPSLAPDRNAFPDERVFVLRVNCSRTTKRQLHYHKGDFDSCSVDRDKSGSCEQDSLLLIEGRYLHPVEYYQALLSVTAPALVVQPVFAAFCQPLINTENADALSAGSTNCFRTVHTLDMKVVDVDNVSCDHLGYKYEELRGRSWYGVIHPQDLTDISSKHKLLCEDRESSCVTLYRLQTLNGDWLWTHVVITLKRSYPCTTYVNQRPDDTPPEHRQLIHCVHQIISASEASTLREHAWLYALRSPDEPPGSQGPGGGSTGCLTGGSQTDTSAASSASESGDDYSVGSLRPDTIHTPATPVIHNLCATQLPEFEAADLEAYFNQMSSGGRHTSGCAHLK